MSDIREIKNRIESIKDTRKVTDAMYMIASTKLRKAKRDLDATRPYFDATKNEMKRIFRIDYQLKNRYFYPPEGVKELAPPYAYLLVTSDKGLAGSYNQTAVKTLEKFMKAHGEGTIFPIGEYGRKYCISKGYDVDPDFHYSLQNPTLEFARKITALLLHRYDLHEFKKIYIIYTDLKSAINQESVVGRILPFHRADFSSDGEKHGNESNFSFYPDVDTVLNKMVFSYMSGYIFSALIDSFSCEQNARMNAMDEANRNADDILRELSLEYNHARQGKITQEITEISAGARALKRKNIKKSEGVR